jgi:hypothetical protein
MDTGLWTGHCNSSDTGHHHHGACPTNPEARCNSSWGLHGMCRWNPAGDGGCYEFDACYNLTVRPATPSARR